MATSETWNDPDRCPFCGDALTSPDTGFMAHITERPSCDDAFGTWREHVREDVAGGWGG
jgi:hypothetical protein